MFATHFMHTSVAFVILNYQSYQDTIRVTKEILAFDQEDFRIIIIDNASPNESFDKLNRTFDGNHNVTVVKNDSNNGYAKGNNVGLRYLKCIEPTYVCVINNDVHFTLQTINSLCKWYEILPAPAVISPVQILPNKEIAQIATLEIPTLCYDLRTYTVLFQPPKHKYAPNTNIRNVQKVGIVPGAFVFIKYKLFEDIGFFDEDTFLFCEERFLGRKVAINNYNNYIILNETYIHEHSKTINKESSKLMQQEYLFDGKIRFWKKYSSIPRVAILLLTIMKTIYDVEIKLLKGIKSIIR